MANSNEPNAKADRSHLDEVLSAVPQPNRATRRKIEAKGDAVPVTLSPESANTQDAAVSVAESKLAAAAESTQQDEPALPQSVVVQSDIQSARQPSPESGAEASPPATSAKRAVGARKAPTAAKPAAAKPAAVKPLAPEPIPAEAQSAFPSPAELDASALEAATPVSSSEPSLGANSAQPGSPISQSNFPVFSIKDMTMDMSTNFAGFQTAMTEAQAKAKAAFEKSSSAMGEVGEFTKGNVEAVIASGRILAEGCQEIGSTLVAESRTAFEAMTGDIKELAAAKSPTDFLKIQSDMLRKSFDSAVAYSSKNSETFLKLMSDAAAPLSGRVSLAVEKVRQTATTTPATV